MEYRAGKCSQCGAEYQVPASFAHNVARCKKCSGVVHLSAAARGPAAATSPAVEPALRVEPQRAAAGARPAPPAQQRTADRPETAGASADRSTHRPSPLAAATPTPVAQPAQGVREPARERGRRPAAAVVIGLALVALAAVLFLFRTRIFGGG